MSKKQTKLRPKNTEYITNFASDGKKPLGLSPRMGLSRKSRPSPKLFKSPLLNPPVNYPDYSPASTSSTPLKSTTILTKTEDTTITNDIDCDDLNKTPKDKTNVRLSKRKKAKKNLQDDFDDTSEVATVTDDIDKTLEIQDKGKKTIDDTNNKIESDSVSPLKDKITNFDDLLISPVLLKDKSDDETSGRKSTRVRVTKKLVEETMDIDKKKSPGTQKQRVVARKDNKKSVMQDDKDYVEVCMENIVENIEKPVTQQNDIQDKVEIVTKKTRGRPKKRKIIDSEEENVADDPPSLNIVSPLKQVKPNNGEYSRVTRSTEKKSPDCPILSPQNVARNNLKGKKIKKVNRRIITSEDEEETEEQKNTVALKENLSNKSTNLVKNQSEEDLLPLSVIAKNTNITKVDSAHQTKSENINKGDLQTLDKIVCDRNNEDDLEVAVSVNKTPKTYLKTPSFLLNTNFGKIEMPSFVERKAENPLRKRPSLTLKKSSSNLSDKDNKIVVKDNKMIVEENNPVSDDSKMSDVTSLRNECLELHNQIEVKKKTLEDICKRQKKTEELNVLTKKWEIGAKEALLALHQKLTKDGAVFDMDALLMKFNAPPDVFKFDSFEYSFV